MQLLSSLFELPNEEKLCKSERAQVIKELYAIYTSPLERILRKKENWKRYCAFCRASKQANTKEAQELFKKGKTYIKEQPIKTIIFFLSHIPTKDLYYIKSQMQDCSNRGKSASAWLFFNTRYNTK